MGIALDACSAETYNLRVGSAAHDVFFTRLTIGPIGFPSLMVGGDLVKIRLHVYFLLLLAITTTVDAADWTHWRGPEQNGISREKGLPDKLGPETQLWEAPVGGRSTPIILNGRLYLNCRTLDDVNDPKEKIHAQEQVVCLDAKTGEELWRDRFNVFQTDIPSARVGWASMAGDKETGYVYMHSVSGLFRCYTPDGKVVWEYSLFEDFGKISGYGGRTQTPIIDEDRVIVSYLTMNWGKTKVPPPKQTYYAFDKRTGKLLWVSAPGGRPYDTNYSVPFVTVIGGERMLIGGNSDGGIYGINARTGRKLWGVVMSWRGLNAAPVADGKLVYISHGEENRDAVEFGRVQCIDATGRGDIAKTHTVWRVDGIKAGYTGLLVKDGILYVVDDGGILHAFDSANGNRLWEYTLGTVGKGSPVWADGKIYAVETNGSVHVLKPSRKGCETLDHLKLKAKNSPGFDEIYASPAIADGRIYIVTRDRTLCYGRKGARPTSDPVPPMAAESKVKGAKLAMVQLVPYETAVWAGEKVEYELRVFGEKGQRVGTVKPTIALGKGLSKATVNGAVLTTANAGVDQGGTVTAKFGSLTASARVRVFPPLPWKWDFEGFKGKQLPPSWIRAFPKLQPATVDGSVALRNRPVRGRPSHFVWLGPSTMKGYTLRADVMARKPKRRMANIGLTANRYNLILMGNLQRLQVQSWAPHLRMEKDVKFSWKPDVWYTLKLRVMVEGEKARVLGKAWRRGDPEPDAWTIEQVDPHANKRGSPGLYLYALSESYFDNVSVTKGQ